MLFMVIENFKEANPEPIGDRFRRSGRMLPDGVTYHASWVDWTGGRCFQLMEAETEQMLAEWTEKWDDLADFEIVPVLTSADFWASASSS